MVMKNSEYRTSYKPADEAQVKSYEQNLDFRTSRKSREFEHNQDVFCWCPQAWDKPTDTESVLEEPRPGSVPTHRYKHRLYNQMFQEKQLRTSLEQHCVVSGAGNKPAGAKQTEEEGPPSPPPSPETSSTPPCNGEVKQSLSIQIQDPSNKRPTKPQQRVVSKKSAVGPKSSTGVPKQSATHSPREYKPPFVMYGSRDREIKIGQQKTHNIKAPVDVYPSALRAQKYRQLLREKRLKSAPQPGKRKPLSFDELMDKQTANWQTEYRGHFVGYEKKNYERNVCSRMGGRKSVDF